MLKNFFQKKFQKKECACSSNETPLTEIENGHSVRIQCLKGEAGACQRLREMGFCESAVVHKIADSGALICQVCDAKLVISKDLAQNIIVKDVCHMNENHMLLSQMSIGQKGTIIDFVIEGDDCERIEEMGVTPGEKVEVVRYAPLGDPIEIKIRGYSLSLRKKEADLIKVNLTA